MAYYILKDKNGNLSFGERDGFVPKEAVLKVNDDSLRHKKIKIIDEPILNPDGSKILDSDGKAITKKVAVEDPVAQYRYEQELINKKEQAKWDSMRAERDGLIDSTIWRYQRHQQEIALGKPTTLSAYEYAQWLTYWDQLRDLPDNISDIDNIDWPNKPS